jgi:hypothetical protein
VVLDVETNLLFGGGGRGGLGETNGKNSLHKKAKGEEHGPPTPAPCKTPSSSFFFKKNYGTLGGILRTFGFIKPPIS